MGFNKMEKNFNLALVLGGGGARGLAHIGVLKILEREGIRPDLIVGTSMGAIIGAVYAQQESAQMVEDIVLDYLDDFVKQKQWFKLLNFASSKEKHTLFADLTNYIYKRIMGLRAITKISLEPKETLLEPLKNIIVDGNMEDCRIPFAAVTVDLIEGQMLVLNKGPIIDAVYASAAIEGVFPPLEYYGGLLADGGPVNITPVEVARDFGSKKVIAVDIHQDIKRIEKLSTGLEIKSH